MAERIERFLQQRGIKKETFFKEIGINKNVFHYWKRGVMPAADKALYIARFLGVSVEFLLTGEDSSGFRLDEYETEFIARSRIYAKTEEEKAALKVKIELIFQGIDERKKREEELIAKAKAEAIREMEEKQAEQRQMQQIQILRLQGESEHGVKF